MKVKGTYVVTDDNYELEIYYEYYWNDGIITTLQKTIWKFWR